MPATVLVLMLAALLPAAALAQTTLNKCTDGHGRVTYSNLPCPTSRTAEEIEIDPPPARTDDPRAAAKEATPARSPSSRSAPERKPRHAAARVPARQCDALADRLGRVLDKMDHARRHGYTLEQMNRWNAEVRELERKKQQSGCF
jgi:hypothetical protein